MPITKSAKKAVRQSKRRKLRNILKNKKFRSLVKEFRKVINDKSFDKAKELLPRVYKSLDKAAKTGTIKKNKAARLKSRLATLANKSIAGAI